MLFWICNFVAIRRQLHVNALKFNAWKPLLYGQYKASITNVYDSPDILGR